MIYLNVELADGIEMNVPLYGDGMFSLCPKCGVRVPVDFEMLKCVQFDTAASFYCEKCTVDTIGQK